MDGEPRRALMREFLMERDVDGMMTGSFGCFLTGDLQLQDLEEVRLGYYALYLALV